MSVSSMVMSWVRDHPMMVVAAAVGASTAGTILYQHRGLARALQAFRITRAINTPRRDIYIITSEEGWNKVSCQLESEARRVGAVGFDCEWVQVHGGRRPVALLQLASCAGTCVLVRLNHLQSGIPNSLKKFLADETILKVGVGPLDDSNYLTADYNMEVQGCVDLRHLVLLSLQNLDKEMKGYGLNTLSQKYLKRTLDKDWRIRASNWEAERLTERQRKYAAEDAVVGVHILVALIDQLWQVPSWVPLLPSWLWCRQLATAIHSICGRFVGIKYSAGRSEQDGGGSNAAATVTSSNMSASQVDLSKAKPLTRAYSIRKGPLYHNCQLRAPDDQPLCVCDPKKAQWYISKGLGVLVSEDPLVVRLTFEPSGRPQVEQEDGQFYLQERQNVCVVCCQDKSYIRKNVVPHEYRKFFPDVLKDHQSHDVVLLCLECHKLSNLHDRNMRHRLAAEFDAPIGTECDIKVSIDRVRKVMKNAASALLRNRDIMPEGRIAELENRLKEHFSTEELTNDLLTKIANMDVKIWNDDYQAHGQKVYEAFAKIGCVKLEQKWREHFLATMKPQHMPQGWSVTHNLFKMQLKASQFPPGHPEREKYKIALVGTEGNIDNIPYNPKARRGSTISDSSRSTSRETTPEELPESFPPAVNAVLANESLKTEPYCRAGGC